MGKRRPKKSSSEQQIDEEDMASAPKQQTVELTDLDLPQLSEVKKQLEEELNHLTNSFSQLRQAQTRFQDCIDSVESIRKRKAELIETDKVIVDVGTGYYVEKTSEEALKFYGEKVEFVKNNLETLQQTITSKQNNLRITLEVMQMKISQGIASSSKS
ncbi:5308_t:CDS:2 [Acaulospora colombiana]|uniref:5308_t:CDS:1 n=1 Tax=Acaulospora colombiana TaxID=27376 RepID=A0ACA9LJA8_9GLOM|nr:5308_t:CDS:2 [Acaulospora colombiana]